MSPVTAGPALERPLDLGSAFSTSWQVMRARYGTHVLVSLLPALVGAVGAALLVALVVALGAGAMSGGDSTAAVVVAVVGYVALLLVIGLVQLRTEGMKAVLVHQTLEGRRPRVGDLWRETRGYWGRALPYFLLLALATTVLLSTLVVPGLLAALSENPEDAIGLAVVVTALLYLVLLVGIVWLSVRLIPVTMVMAVERHGGLAAARRAWQLTDGHFWRTLGYIYLASLIPTAIISFAWMIGYFISIAAYIGSMAAMMNEVTSGGPMDFESMVGTFGATLVASIVGALIPVVAAVLVQPFTSCFTTTYAMDLARRQTGPGDPPSPAGGWQPTPYPPQPVQQWAGVPAAPPWAAGAGPYGVPGQPPFGAAPGQPPFGAGPGQPSSGAAPGQPSFAAGPGQSSYGAGPGQSSYGAGPGQSSYGAGPGQSSSGPGSGQPPYGGAPGQEAYGATPGEPPFGAAPGQPPWGPGTSQPPGWDTSARPTYEAPAQPPHPDGPGQPSAWGPGPQPPQDGQPDQPPPWGGPQTPRP